MNAPNNLRNEEVRLMGMTMTQKILARAAGLDQGQAGQL